MIASELRTTPNAFVVEATGKEALQRTHCTQVSSMSGFQSYVELITCLEIAQEAGKLPKQ